MMTSTETTNTQQPCKLYPYLGVWFSHTGTKTVVLLTEPRTGTVVFSDDPEENNLGEYSTSWSEEHFAKYEGTVHLTND